MPVYEYRCPSCDTVFDFERGMRDKSVIHCPECGTDAVRVYTPSGMILKGSGFFNTDYKGDGERTKEAKMDKSADEAKHPDATANADTGTAASKAPNCPVATGACQACPAAN